MATDSSQEQEKIEELTSLPSSDGGQDAKVDEKSRLRLPAKFRHDLQESNKENRYFVTINMDMNCARIYPKPVWERMKQQLQQLPLERVKIDYLRMLKRFGDETTLDQQGRILIPLALRTRVKISGNVTVLGFTNYLEVWNQDVLDETLRPFDLEAQDKLTAMDNVF